MTDTITNTDLDAAAQRVFESLPKGELWTVNAQQQSTVSLSLVNPKVPARYSTFDIVVMRGYGREFAEHRESLDKAVEKMLAQIDRAYPERTK